MTSVVERPQTTATSLAQEAAAPYRRRAPAYRPPRRPPQSPLRPVAFHEQSNPRRWWQALLSTISRGLANIFQTGCPACGHGAARALAPANDVPLTDALLYWYACDWCGHRWLQWPVVGDHADW